MSSDYNFVNPSATGANGLLDELAKQTVERRQALLDRITQQQADTQSRNTDSEIAYRGQQADSMGEQRQAVAEWRRSQADKSAADTARHAQFGQKINDFMTSDDFKAMPAQYQQAMKIASMSGDDDLTKAVLTNMSKQEPPEKDPYEPIIHTDRQGNSWDTGAEAPQHAHFTTEPAPQQPTAASMPVKYDFPVPDPTDPTKTVIQSHWLKPGEQPSDANLIRGQAVKGNAPPPKLTKVVPQWDTKAFNTFLQTKADKTPSGPGRQASALAHLISSITDPVVKKDVDDIMGDKDLKQLSAEALVSKGIITGDPEKIQQTADKLKQIRGW